MPLSGIILFGGSTALAYLLVGRAYAAAMEGEVRARISQDFGFVDEVALSLAARRSALRWPWDLALRLTDGRRTQARRHSTKGDRT